MRRSLALVALIGLLGEGAAQEATRRLIVGDAERGRELIRSLGCVACHVIPGVPGRSGRIGPSLDGLVQRPYIAGSLPNRPDALVAWLVDPPRFVPTTAMPALGLTDHQARDIAAYLYSRPR